MCRRLKEMWHLKEFCDLRPLLSSFICRMGRVFPTSWSRCETQARSDVSNGVNFKVLYRREGLWSFYKHKAESGETHTSTP